MVMEVSGEWEGLEPHRRHRPKVTWIKMMVEKVIKKKSDSGYNFNIELTGELNVFTVGHERNIFQI